MESSLAASAAIQFCRLLAARLTYEARMSWRILLTILCRVWVPWIMPLMAVVRAESMGARAAFHLFWTSWAAWPSSFSISRAFFFSATWTSCRIAAIFLGTGPRWSGAARSFAFPGRSPALSGPSPGPVPGWRRSPPEVFLLAYISPAKRQYPSGPASGSFPGAYRPDPYPPCPPPPASSSFPGRRFDNSGNPCRRKLEI